MYTVGGANNEVTESMDGILFFAMTAIQVPRAPDTILDLGRRAHPHVLGEVLC